MHRNILIISTLLIVTATFNVVAQDTDPQPARPDVPGTLLVDFGVNFLMNNSADNFETNAWGSKTANIYYLHDIRLGGSKLFFLPGIGLGFDKYKFDEDVTLATDPDNDFTTVIEDPVNVIGNQDAVVTKSKLAANYIDVPLEFRFYSNPSDKGRSFKAGIGGKVGYLYNSHTKINYDLNDYDNQIKHKQDLNVTKFRYGLSARVGLGSFNLFGYYSLNELFEDGEGPEATEASNLTVGLTINAF